MSDSLVYQMVKMMSQLHDRRPRRPVEYHLSVQAAMVIFHASEDQVRARFKLPVGCKSFVVEG